jgi:hypothetical protein
MNWYFGFLRPQVKLDPYCLLLHFHYLRVYVYIYHIITISHTSPHPFKLPFVDKTGNFRKAIQFLTDEQRAVNSGYEQPLFWAGKKKKKLVWVKIGDGPDQFQRIVPFGEFLVPRSEFLVPRKLSFGELIIERTILIRIQWLPWCSLCPSCA